MNTDPSLANRTHALPPDAPPRGGASGEPDGGSSTPNPARPASHPAGASDPAPIGDAPSGAPAVDEPRNERSESVPRVQGEGDYEAARRHRESVEAFVEAGRVEPAAREAAPADAQEAQALEQAERQGRAPARH